MAQPGLANNKNQFIHAFPLFGSVVKMFGAILLGDFDAASKPNSVVFTAIPLKMFPAEPCPNNIITVSVFFGKKKIHLLQPT